MANAIPKIEAKKTASRKANNFKITHERNALDIVCCSETMNTRTKFHAHRPTDRPSCVCVCVRYDSCLFIEWILLRLLLLGHFHFMNLVKCFRLVRRNSSVRCFCKEQTTNWHLWRLAEAENTSFTTNNCNSIRHWLADGQSNSRWWWRTAVANFSTVHRSNWDFILSSRRIHNFNLKTIKSITKTRNGRGERNKLKLINSTEPTPAPATAPTMNIHRHNAKSNLIIIKQISSGKSSKRPRTQNLNTDFKSHTPLSDPTTFGSCPATTILVSIQSHFNRWTIFTKKKKFFFSFSFFCVLNRIFGKK